MEGIESKESNFATISIPKTIMPWKKLKWEESNSTYHSTQRIKQLNFLMHIWPSSSCSMWCWWNTVSIYNSIWPCALVKTMKPLTLYFFLHCNSIDQKEMRQKLLPKEIVRFDLFMINQHYINTSHCHPYMQAKLGLGWHRSWQISTI